MNINSQSPVVSKMMTRTRARFTTASQSAVSVSLPVVSAANPDFSPGCPFRSGFATLVLLLVLTCAPAFGSDATNTPSPRAESVQDLFINNSRQFSVSNYIVKGDPLLTNTTFTTVLGHHTGTNVSTRELVKAASELQSAYRGAGYTNVTLSLGLEQITNGIAVLHAFRGVTPQLLVDGTRVSGEIVDTNAQSATTTAEAPGPKSAAPTNAVPRLYVRAYEIRGDTLLSTETLTGILAKYTGTNMTVQDIIKAGNELQMEYRNRGFPTVSVTIPPQKLDTNGFVKIRVFEGRLANIEVTHNRFFSSNNVMRALPSLQTNMILSRPVFEAELDRANANQDRQIYPTLEPGSQENTTDLTLDVKDRLPLHAKIDFNNQNSPGTPELRINTSAVYNNLWQWEHSIGVQYSFSPEVYKTGDWNFYDKPLVANYSAFYTMPLGNQGAISDAIATQPGSFGFDEATRQFRLPPPAGRPELNLFASRSTIDTGLETLENKVLFNVPGVRQVSRQDVQEDTTLNEDLGFRLSSPVVTSAKWRSSLSGGLDYKHYSLTSNKTNIFSFTEITVNGNGVTNPPIISKVDSPVPTTAEELRYTSLSARWDATERDALGSTTFGLGYSGNLWYSGSRASLQRITGSTRSTGNWLTLTPSISRDFNIHTNWVLSLRANGQLASEPLISTEQFGAGGINSVRGYHEGEVFGDDGWRVSAEQSTPPYVVGLAYKGAPLTVRGAIYMDYAQTYLLDPNGAPSHVFLWGTGVGAVISVGPNWEARLLSSWPLLTAGTIEAYQPFFNFSLSAQF